MYPYRFKTEEEFENEYGENWRDKFSPLNILPEFGYAWLPEMDILFGKIYPYYIDIKKIENRGLEDLHFDNHTYGISKYMLTDSKPKKPSYKPKGKIKRIDESINNLDINEHDCVIFRVENVEEYKKIEEALSNRISKDFEGNYYHNKSIDYPNYFFVRIKPTHGNFDSIRCWSRRNTYDDIDHLLRTVQSTKWYYPTILNINHLNNVINFIKHGAIRPSYDPKGRVTRIGESSDIYDNIDIFVSGIDNILEFEDLLINSGLNWNGRPKGKKILKDDYLFIINEYKKATFHINKKGFYIAANFSHLPRNVISFNYPSQKYQILEYLKLRPSYKPKGKIKRIDESVGGLNKSYECVIFKVDSYEDYLIIENRLSEEISHNFKNPSINGNEYSFPNYLFVRLKHTVSVGFEPIRFWSNDNHLSTQQHLFNHIDSTYYYYPKILNINHLNNVINFIKHGEKPSYKPKGKITRIDESSNTTEMIVVKINSKKESEIFQKLCFEYGYYWDLLVDNDTIKDWGISYLVIKFDHKILYISSYISSSSLDIETLLKVYNWSGNIYNIDDYETVKIILKTGKEIFKPSYKPKGKIKRTMESFKDFLLEKSSITKFGVPRNVMQPIQKDYAISPEADWDKVELKKDAINIFRKGEKDLILQISHDSIRVFVSFIVDGEKKYFMDYYVYKEDGWGGEHRKLPREHLSMTQLFIYIKAESLKYHLKDDFSIIKQPKRISKKKEVQFDEFTEKFKKDFLENFDSILRRIVTSKFKKAKKEINDKAKQIEIENQMMISGLSDPLSGPNSLSILDEFLISFEDKYSEFFGERLDIKELCDYFTREKIMTSFMYFIYTGKILTK